jgi:hypothetical protein
MAGVKLTFPRTKLDGQESSAAEVRYEGENFWWTANPTRHHLVPTQDTVISDFMITLNRRTFQPVVSKDDLVSFAVSYVRPYGDEDLPPESSRWLQFVFSPDIYSQGNGQLKRLYEEQTAASAKLLGPLVPRRDELGLRKVSSDQEGGAFLKAEGRNVYDTWYYDDRSWQTMIVCMRHTDTTSPLKLSCVHYFVVPEFKAVASGIYTTTTDLTQWEHIEAEFRNRALSFRVEAPGR